MLIRNPKAGWSVLLTAVVACAVILSNAAPARAGTLRPEGKRGGRVNFEQIITRAKRKVFPALVFVKVIRRSFKAGKQQRRQVVGSGVIISKDGLVVTNHHVIKNALRIQCVLGSKKQVDAELVGKDKETDLALLKLEYEDEDPLPTGEFGNSDKVTEGQFVMALGAPFGFTRSISLGIISHSRRYIGFQTEYKYNLWLQTDASITEGNSGGPLVNSAGKIIGINTLGVLPGAMSFALPSNLVQKVVRRLEENGKVKRAWTGLQLQPLKDFKTNTFIDAEKGVLIKGVAQNSPGSHAGVQKGDLLLKINGKDVNGTYAESLPVIKWRLADLPTGEPATLTIRRGGEKKKIKMTPVLKGDVEGEDFDCARWDMTVKGITRYSTPDLYFYREKGVFIQAVQHPGNAANAGLQEDDILLQIGDAEIRTIEDVKKAYEELTSEDREEKEVLVTVLREGMKRTFVLKYYSEYDEEG